MSTTKKIDINKQIIFEKGNFLLNNSSYFYKNLKDNEENLKNLLLSPLPLKYCPDYDEIINEMNDSKIRNCTQLSYKYSLEILFHIVNMLRKNPISSEENIELIRAYVKSISSTFTDSERKIYYSSQKLIKINKEKVEDINEEIKKYQKR